MTTIPMTLSDEAFELLACETPSEILGRLDALPRAVLRSVGAELVVHLAFLRSALRERHGVSLAWERPTPAMRRAEAEAEAAMQAAT